MTTRRDFIRQAALLGAGLSMNPFLASQAATIWRQCQWSGVPMITTSTSLLSISFRQSL